MLKKTTYIFILLIIITVISCTSVGEIVEPIQYNNGSAIAYIFFLRLDEADPKNNWSIKIDNVEKARIGSNNYFLCTVEPGIHNINIFGNNVGSSSLQVNLDTNEMTLFRAYIQYGKLTISRIDSEYMYIYSTVTENIDKKNSDYAITLLNQEMLRQKTIHQSNPREEDELSVKIAELQEMKEIIQNNIESIKNQIAENNYQQQDNTRKAIYETNSVAKLAYTLAATANTTAVLILSARMQKIKKEQEATIQVIRDLQTEQRSAYKLASAKNSANQNIPIQQRGIPNLDFVLSSGESSFSGNTIVIIMGNKDYKNNIPTVEYALNDAVAIKEFCIKCLGIQENNIIYKENSTLNDFISFFGSTNNTDDAYEKSRLYRTASIMDAPPNAIIYYSGHGAPATSGGTKGSGYLVPIDADVSIIQNTGYPIAAITEHINKMHAMGIIENSWIIIDACFSGRDNNGRLLQQNVSGLSIVPVIPNKSIDNDILMYAASGDEYASWYPEKKHGLFTYFFLKGISGDADIDCNSIISLDELKSYIEKKVAKFSNNINAQEQNPQIITSTNNEIIIYK